MTASVEIFLSPNIIGNWFTWHGLLSAVGVIIILVITIWGARKWVSFDKSYTIALVATVGGLIGARFVHYIDNLDIYTGAFDFLRVWEGGIGLWGTLIGAALTAMLASRYIVKNSWRTTGAVLDYLAIAAPIGLAFGRIGDIINGEHCATPTNLPWGSIYTHPSSPGFACITDSARLSQGYFAPGTDPFTTAVHPAIAYEMLWLVGMTVVLLLLRGRLQPPGGVFFISFLMYAVGRFLVQLVRLDDAYIGFLQQAHLIAIGTAVVAIAFLIYLRPRWDKTVTRSIWSGFRFPSSVADIRRMTGADRRRQGASRY